MSNARYCINIYLINAQQNGFKLVLLDESVDHNLHIYVKQYTNEYDHISIKFLQVLQQHRSSQV